MDEKVFERLETIKNEMNEAQKRKKAEDEKRRKEEAEAQSFEKMMQAEGTKKLGSGR